MLEYIGEEGVLYHFENNAYNRSNSTMSRLFQLIQDRKSIEEMVAVLTDEFDVDENTCREQVKASIADLLAREIITEG